MKEKKSIEMRSVVLKFPTEESKSVFMKIEKIIRVEKI